jgi:hypothetical protein
MPLSRFRHLGSTKTLTDMRAQTSTWSNALVLHGVGRRLGTRTRLVWPNYRCFRLGELCRGPGPTRHRSQGPMTESAAALW